MPRIGAAGKWRIIVITSSVHSVTRVPRQLPLAFVTLSSDFKEELKTKATYN